MLKFLRITKVSNIMDLFALSGIIFDRRTIENKLNNELLKIFLLFMPIFIFLALNNILSKGFIVIYLIIFIGFILLIMYMIDNSIIPKKLKKVFYKTLKKKINSSLKDEEFIKFIDSNYWEIKQMNLSKKETIALLNNWKERKSEINEKRVKKEKEAWEEEYSKKEKELEELGYLIKNIK